MGKKTKRKNNTRLLRPPLTFLDKSIYFLCIILSFLVTLLSVYCFGDIQDMIAFSKAEAIAYRSHASSLFVVPFIMFFEISAITVFVCGLESKKPIFGSKKYNYGEYPFREDCIPLFHQRKYYTKKMLSKKKFAHQMTVLWCVGLFLCACLIPFSLFGRNVLCQDNRIENINVLNLISDTYTTDDFAHLTVKAQYVSGYRSADYWKYEITIKMNNGKNFSFSNRDFDLHVSGVKDICLDKMLEIKSLFDAEEITIKGAKNTNEVADYLGFNESQHAKLNELFTE